MSEDVAAQRAGSLSWGTDPHYTKLYFEKYNRLNPIPLPILLLKVGEVRSASQLLPTDQFRATRFYKEWARPAGYGDNTLGVIEKSASVVTFLATSHHDHLSPVGAK